MNFKWTGLSNNSRCPFRHSILVIISLQLIIASCSLYPTKPGSTDIRFDMNFKYVDEKNISAPLLSLDRSRGENAPLSKPSEPVMIDVVCVLVLDFSKYNDLEEFFASEEYHEFIHVSSEWSGNLQYWAEWEKLFSQVLSIASNQTISIEGDSAIGNVPGVIGMNYFIVAMLENGKIRYAGENMAVGEEGKTQTIYIEMVQWFFDDYNYYNESTVAYIDITPDRATVYNGGLQALNCTIYYTDGTSRLNTNAPVWTTSPGIAGTISATGNFIADPVNTGIETITATYYSNNIAFQDSAVVTVIPYTTGPPPYYYP
jgi:hypothetical protein